MRSSSLAPGFALSLFAAGCMGGIGSAPAPGEASSAIIGGTNDTADPGVVLLFAQQPGAMGGSLCTAEIISPHVVLTAAHCVSPVEVGAGAVFTVFTGPDFNQQAGGQTLSVKETHPNPNWVSTNLAGGHDVGIVVLNNATTIAPLPYNRSAMAQAMVGQPVRFVGYGLNDAVNQLGAGLKRQTSTMLSDYDTTKLHFSDGTHETCNGDSGGPAFMMINGVETIVGTTSYGDINCAQGGYDTRVDAETAFIDMYVTANDPQQMQPPPTTPPAMNPPPTGGNPSPSGSPGTGSPPTTGMPGGPSSHAPTALAELGQRCNVDAECASHSCGIGNTGATVCVAGSNDAAQSGMVGGCTIIGGAGPAGDTSALALILLACGALLWRRRKA